MHIKKVIYQLFNVLSQDPFTDLGSAPLLLHTFTSGIEFHVPCVLFCMLSFLSFLLSWRNSWWRLQEEDPGTVLDTLKLKWPKSHLPGVLFQSVLVLLFPFTGQEHARGRTNPERSGDIITCATRMLQFSSEMQQTWHTYYPRPQEQLLLKMFFYKFRP
jgi:hypothetical protein